jgi:hypothetical protein
VQEISLDLLRQARNQVLRTTRTATLAQLGQIIPGLPEGEIGELSLAQALSRVPDLFQATEEGWRAMPPPWGKAVGAYYVYDPNTYEIILKPGEKLKKKVAERLVELGFYADVVTESAADD